jgi:FdhD protein
LAGKLSKSGETMGTADPEMATPPGAEAAAPLPEAAGTLAVRIQRATASRRTQVEDRVAVEAPLEFLLHHPSLGPEPTSFGTTMRTPGDDESLAAGLLYGEGIVHRSADIEALESSTRRPNVVNVRLHSSVQIAPNTPSRLFSAGSSCGVCGTTGLDAAIARAAATRIPDTGHVPLSLLMQLPGRLRSAQSKFEFTGGVHASGLFDFSGTMLNLAEDVGRHNAFDKLVGASFLADELPWSHRIVVLSGRASFELVQKALRAGVSILAAIGAPSSLAVNLAVTSGLTLVGFLRETQCNVYSHPDRLTLDGAAA